MEVSPGLSPRRNHDSERQSFEMEPIDHSLQSNHRFRSNSALEILNEAIRILRCNLRSFMGIAALLICPLSAIVLSNILVKRSLVKKLTLKLLLIAQSSGLPLKPFIKQVCHKFSEMAISTITCFPLYITLALISKSAIMYSVECTYARKIFNTSKFYAFFTDTWRHLISTYLWTCAVFVGSSMLCIVFVVIVSSLLSEIGFYSDLITYPVIILGLLLCVLFANAVVICKLAIAISVLEEVSGFEALLRSRILVKGQMQLGISLVLGSTVCMAFVEGLFDHRVKTISYGDGSSRLWEGPLLVIMYSFVVLMDEMVSTVFYFSCKIYSIEGSDEEREPVLEAMEISSAVQ